MQPLPVRLHVDTALVRLHLEPYPTWTSTCKLLQRSLAGMLESKHRRPEQIGSASSDASVNRCLLHRYIWAKSPKDVNDVQTLDLTKALSTLPCGAAMRCGPSLELSQRYRVQLGVVQPDKASRISCRLSMLMQMALAICSSRMRGAAGVGHSGRPGAQGAAASRAMPTKSY